MLGVIEDQIGENEDVEARAGAIFVARVWEMGEEVGGGSAPEVAFDCHCGFGRGEERL